MYFALFYETVEDFVELRQPFRELLVFRGDTSAVAKDFACADIWIVADG